MAFRRAWIAPLAAVAALAGATARSDSGSDAAREQAAALLEGAERKWQDAAFVPAITALREALDLGRRLADPSLQAAALDLLGCVYDGQGLGQRGLSNHQQALELARAAGNRRLEGRILAHTALGFWTRAEYGQAEDSCGQALAVQRSIGDRSGEAATLHYLGLIQYKQGDYNQGLASLRSALALREAAGERAAQARTLGDLAQVYRDLRQHGTAVELYHRGLAMLEQLGDRSGQSEMLGEMGVAYVMQGADREAVGYFRRALELADQAGSQSARASALHHLAIAYSARGWYERALESYSGSLTLRAELGDLRAQAWIWARMGRVSSRQGNHIEALDRYHRATEIWEAIVDRRALASHLNEVAATHERVGDDHRALAVYLRALELVNEIRLPYRSLSLGSIGGVYARLGERDRALEYGARAVSAANQVGNAEMRWRAYYARGSIEVVLGLPDDALRSFEESLRIIEDLREEGVRSDEAKTAYMESKQQVYAASVALLMAAGKPAPALELAERARARAFLDLLGSRGRARASASIGSERAADLASPASVAPPSLTQLQALARRHGEPIVEYFVGDHAVFIWIVNPDGSIRGTSSKVPRAELERLVDSARRSLRADVAARDWRDEERSAVFGELPAAADAPSVEPHEPNDARPVLRRLHELLVEPVEASLPADPEQPVTLVPHGKLFLVSFAALRDRSGRYLLERHVLHYSPAISVLRYTEGRIANRQQPPSVLVVGNPAMPTLPGRTRPLSPLPGAELEARAIGRLFRPEQVTALTGAAAREHTVSGLAGGRSILHLATHGVIRDDDPLGSLLALAPGGSGPAGDGLWTAREVFDLRLSADLVTLSACNTGLGKVSGDGVIGLSRAFLYAGTPSVLVSLWRVADSVTRFQMERFYQELIASHGAKAKALRRAQLDTIAALRAGRLASESGKALLEDPAYWAPFVLVGEAN